MNNWDVNRLDLKAHRPQILSSTPGARAIALAIPARESLQDHQVHERAWVMVLAGEVQITTTAGERIVATPGVVVQFDPGERHAVFAVTDARLLLLLTPWPGAGHPGAMSLEDKDDAVAHAADHRDALRRGVAMDSDHGVQRLLFVADAAVADVDELPAEVRALLEAATHVYVITPTLPGRLAWLADEVDRFRHVADARLDTVLGHMRTVGAEASGDALRGSVMTVIADGVEMFGPDHILLALRRPGQANWQEHGLVEHVQRRFALPVTSYVVELGLRAARAEATGVTKG